MMKTKLTLFVTVLAAALFGVGCASTEPAFVKVGLIAHYSLEGNAKDASGNLPELAMDGNIYYVDNAASGKSAEFNKGYFKASVPQFIKSDDPYTFTMWVYPKSDVVGLYHLYGGDDTRGGSSRLGIASGFLHVDVSFVETRTDIRALKDSWQLVCMSWDKTQYSVYQATEIGLKKWHSEGRFPRSNLAPNILEIGQYHSYGKRYQMEGMMKNIRIYNRALSAEEVKALYDLEKPKGK